MADKNNQTGEQENLSQLLQIRRDKLKELQESGNDPFTITRYVVDNDSANIKDNFDALEGQEVSLAGRLMSKRGMGKVSFCDLQDKSGRIQLYARKDEMDEAEYARFKKYDIGDIVGVKGVVFRTQRGEMSVRVVKVTLLSKSLLPLPEKFHGLTSTELRYRQRYVDLIVNPDVKRNFTIRSKFIKYVRDFMDGRGFMEVETPVLNTISGGATARPFITHHNTLDIDMYMRIATELHLKRLIVGGLERVYEIGRIFRNEGMDTKHNPEFTTVELYEAYADFNDMMDLFEDFLSSAAQNILGTYQVQWQGEDIDLSPGWRRLTMAQAVEEYLGVDFMAIPEDAAAVAAAKAAKIHSYIMQLPQGYNTVLTEDGVNISKGQKQMLTIARAMLINSKMLILDEATSNVDTQTEQQIQQAMQSLMKGKTCFVIAHRLSTIQNADQILVVNKGSVVEQGTHSQLLAKQGFYAQLYNSQFQ